MDAECAREDVVNARIKAEINRLAKIFKKIDKKHLKSAEKLIARAAFSLVLLEDMEGEIKRDGPVTKMQQGEYAIERAHPLIPQYSAVLKIYAAICKQLNDLLPEAQDMEAAKEITAFIASRGSKL